MNFYSYSPTDGMQYHPTKEEAIETIDAALKFTPNHTPFATWGEVTARATDTGAGYVLKRQDLLSYEAAHPQVIDGKMENSFGDLIQLKNIKPKDILTHDAVLSIAVIWMASSARMKRFKGYALMEIMALADALFEQYGVKRGGSEGNMDFKTYDGRFKLVVGIQKTLTFGAEIQAARQKMIAALDSYPAEADDLKTIVTTAFTQIDGQLRVAEILRLRNIDIKNALWIEGMEIVAESLRVESSKKHLRLYVRDDQGQYEAVPLNIAAL